MTALIPWNWKRHLSEARLFDCYLAERGGEGIDPPAAEHLADCRKCRGRFDALTGFMDDTWTAADEETSALFTPDRLLLQRQEIARRLELLGSGGRVLTFRAGAEGVDGMGRLDRRVDRTISRAAAGWIAAAAAAGLFVGLGAGMFYDGRSLRTPTGTTISQPPAERQEPTQVEAPVAPPQDDDSLLFSELEAAATRPRMPELDALDAMTPRVREISNRIR